MAGSFQWARPESAIPLQRGSVGRVTADRHQPVSENHWNGDVLLDVSKSTQWY